MRVLMLSWEYPPKSVGGLAQHVYDLTRALVKQGVEVHLVTLAAGGVPAEEIVHGVRVYRVEPYNLSAHNFVNWATQMNIALLEKIIYLQQKMGGFALVHAHDWLVAFAARAVKHALRIPLLATIHATEYGRNYGLHTDMQRQISDIEWWLCFEAWKVICCSHYMRGEVRHVFQLPEDKVIVIPNGVDVSNFSTVSTQARREHYAAPDEKIVFYVGRLVREKGVQVLLDAAPQILRHYPQAKFVIAGRGQYEGTLRYQAEQMGIAHRIYFTGYVDDALRNSLYKWASVAVFPSLYEPFGIVALEAMAAGTPVVVSDTGGLSEIVRHGVDGLKAYAGNPASLAEMILQILHNDELAERLRQTAYRRVVEQFSWSQIAARTAEVYRQVVEAGRQTAWYAFAERSSGFLEKVTRFWSRPAI
ncbi:glycosyltransferase family 4 protein [Desulfurispora thermophila]|uniref:glycosyltransferase family 4 protein n=1 Tax=Desulfurispora thermophila TaxID=265470 RepID=UPI000362B1C8|nr:glycosyltransferase family 4 protein [Desulfurispora thermophila]